MGDFDIDGTLGVTVINPFGAGIYSEIWRHAGGIDLSLIIAEWVPPVIWLRCVILISAIWMGSYILFAGRRWGFVYVCVLIGMTFLALSARRNGPDFWLVGGALIALTPVCAEARRWGRVRKDLWQSGVLLGASILAVLILVFVVPGVLNVNRWSGWEIEDMKVKGAVDYLKTQKDTDNVFNRYEWGGYLIWAMPERMIFADGRMPAWVGPGGKSPYTIYLETLQNQPGWQETLAKYEMKWILISPGTFMDLLLAPDPSKFGWKERYRDEWSVVYRKMG